MSEQGIKRPVLLALTGIAATIVVLLAYHRYTQASSNTASSLHRSNAIRRSRRRWRRGFAPRELDRDPMGKAIENLRARIQERRPYGRYNNLLVIRVSNEQLEEGVFDLLPENIVPIYTVLSLMHSMSDTEKDKLKFHISALFVQNFLQEEFPPGWIIGEDIEMLVQELSTQDIDPECIRMMARYFDTGKPLLQENWDIRDDPASRRANSDSQSDGAIEQVSTQQAVEALAGPPHGDGSDSSSDDEAESDPGGSQNMLDLLYHIAGGQAKREGFIHRDVGCNSCGVSPIQGIRYHCANCFDYDLCEDCEAQQVHNKSHVFYKVRIPAPPRGHIKQVAPVWYPGLPNAFPNTMPRDLLRRLVDEVGMDKTEMEASYEQFKCLAGEQIPVENDPAGLGMAISRSNFDKFFTPTSADRPPPPNLIYDRIFAFYDIHNDGVITLDEYIIGIFTLMDKSRAARLKRIFQGFDLDRDGYVDRRDFLRMFRAFYALNKELNREMIALQDELADDIRDVVQGSQPISAAFSGHYFVGHASRGGQDKVADEDGDLIIAQGPNGVLKNDSDMRGERTRAIGNAAVRDRTLTHPFRSFRQQPELDEQLLYLPFTAGSREEASIPFADDVDDEELVGPDPALHVYGWPPQQTPEREDVLAALGMDIPIEDVMDPIDRSRVIFAQSQRLDEESDRILERARAMAVREAWRRRQFGLDEEEGLTKPKGYREIDSSDDGTTSCDESPDIVPQTSSSSRRQSMRSRSSSKVRFDDTAIDTDPETRSNTSSRSIPVNERWGGYELSGPERDVGREILYQAVQQGFNELLDPLFKQKEDEAMEAIASKPFRIDWAKELDEHALNLKKKAEEKAEALKQADLLRTQALFSNGVDKAEGARPRVPATQPAPSGTEHDETGHIQIMFGNSQSNAQETSQVTESSSTPATINPVIEQPDPTLPQNKPNDPTIVPPPSPHKSNNKPNTGSNPPDPDPPFPSESTLTTWLNHRKIEKQAQVRGGYGKLSYREFCRIMVREANRDDRTDALDWRGRAGGDERAGDSDENNSPDGAVGGARGRGRANNRDVEGDSDGEDQDEKWWSSTAGMGRMSFVGAWLEMAQF